MAKMINFENYTPTTKTTPSAFNGTGALRVISCNDEVSDADSQSIQDTIELLTKMYPGKMVYTQKEAAKILSMCYSYINKNCADGKIRTVKFGDRQLININEMAKLINEGI